MRKLRRFHDAETTAAIYHGMYDHTQWLEHKARVSHTIDIAQRLINDHNLTTAADWSAGDNAIVSQLEHLDFVSTSDGDIERKLRENTELFDLFICTETIEHLEAPWTILEKIADIARFVVVSTPLDEPAEIGNYEHYWSFTAQDVRDLLAQAGFTDLMCTLISGDAWTYTYQIWTGRSE